MDLEDTPKKGRPKGSTNKPKTVADAKMLNKASTRTRPMEEPKDTTKSMPKKIVACEQDIKPVNKVLNAFKSQGLSEEIKIKNQSTDLSEDSLADVLERMKSEFEKKLTPEEKIKCLGYEIEQLHEAIKKFGVVIDYLETKLGIDN